MKAFYITALLFLLTLAIVLFNALYINRMTFALRGRLDALPDITDSACVPTVEDFCEDWQKKCNLLSLSVGYPIVDRITEQSALLLSCAKCGDRYGYQSALTLLYDAIEDMERLERFRPS